MIMPHSSASFFFFHMCLFLGCSWMGQYGCYWGKWDMKCTFLNIVSSQFLKLILNFDLIHVQNHGKFLQFTTRPQLVGLCQPVVCICSELKKKCKCQACGEHLSMFLSASTALSSPLPQSHWPPGSARSLDSLGSMATRISSYWHHLSVQLQQQHVMRSVNFPL